MRGVRGVYQGEAKTKREPMKEQLDEGLDDRREPIICGRQFFRDIKKKLGKVEAIGLTKGHLKIGYFHFGSFVLHPTRNLLLHEEEQAASSYGNYNYASFPRDFRQNMVDYELEENGVDGVKYKHLQRVNFKRMLDPAYCKKSISARLDCCFEMDSVDAAMGLSLGFKWKIDDGLGLFDWRNRTNDGRFISDVYRITQKQRMRFIDLYMNAFSKPFLLLDVESPNQEEPFWVESMIKEMEREKRRSRENKPIEIRSLQKQKEKMLYLMKDEHTGSYKIGVSVDPEHRENTLASQKPSIKLVGKWEKLSIHEKAWHQYFAQERIRGEWFNLTPAQVRFFCATNTRGEEPPERKPQLATQ